MSDKKKKLDHSVQEAETTRKEDKNEESVDKLEELDNKYKRALADYQNLLKQSAKEKQDFVRYANEQLLLEMIPVYDNLKISLEHLDEEADKNAWAQGIKYVIKQFKEVLENSGVEEIKTVGEKFNPETMEALEGEGESVIKELKSGYKLNGKVIIAARVVVG